MPESEFEFFTSFTLVDLAIGAIMLSSATLGMARGFSQTELLAPVRWLLALALAYALAEPLPAALLPMIPPGLHELTLGSRTYSLLHFYPFGAGATIFVLVNLILINIAQRMDPNPSRGVLLGLLFGVIRGLLIITVLVAATYTTSISLHPAWKFSEFVHAFVDLVDAAAGWFEDDPVPSLPDY